MGTKSGYPFRSDIHARIVAAATSGKLITYGELGTSRRMVGSYLFRITHEEALAKRPPLTALVVHKTDGKPGPGFPEAMEEIGYARPGESDDDVWKRAVADVHDYWRPALGDDSAEWPHIRRSQSTRETNAKLSPG